MNQENSSTSLDEMFATIDSVYAAHPEVVPVSKEQLSETATSTPQQAKTDDTSFNVTKSIQKTLDILRPTTALTKYEVKFLSEEEINSLKPVPDHTITQLLVLFAGKGTRPCMLDGTLLAHTADGAYLEIVPYINKSKNKNKKGYASYKFVVINYKILNFIIDKHIKLLTSTKKYAELLDCDCNCDDVETDGTAFDETDIDMIFGNKPIPKAKATIEDDFIDRDTEILITLKSMLKARKQSTFKHLGMRVLSEKIASQARLHDEDTELLKYLQGVVNRVYKDLEKPYKSPYAPYIDALYISGHHLSMWMADPKEYTDKITNGGGEWSIDHIQQGIEHRSDNRFEKLRIKPAGFNSGRTSRSIGVNYNGTDYVSLSAYCDSTGAGNAKSIKDKKKGLQSGDTFDYKTRTYTIVDDQQLTAVDIEVKASQITYNGIDYATPKAFAKALNLSYNSLSNALNDARKAGESEFERKLSNKKFKFYLDENGNITKIL